MEKYDKEEITHIFDDTVDILTLAPYGKPNWWFFKWSYLIQPSKYYKDDMTDIEKTWVKEFLMGLRSKCKRYGTDYIISQYTYDRYIKEFCNS